MSLTETPAPVFSGEEDELDLDAIRPHSRFLRLRGHRYPVPPKLTVPMMGELLDLEQSIREAGRDPDQPAEDASDRAWEAYEEAVSENRRKAVAAINRAHQAIEELVQAETPGARLQLDVDEIMVVIRWLVRNPGGATGAVVSVIEGAGGAAEPADEDGVVAEATPPGPEGSSPLESEKRSSRRSSGTRTKPASNRAGGNAATGGTSGSPSASPSVA